MKKECRSDYGMRERKRELEGLWNWSLINQKHKKSEVGFAKTLVDISFKVFRLLLPLTI